jgi:hypothetical protein
MVSSLGFSVHDGGIPAALNPVQAPKEFQTGQSLRIHSEFKSKPLKSHPLFRKFIAASYRNRLSREPSSINAVAGEFVLK